MPFDPNKHHRRSVRLRDYDYSQGGAYFITICTQDKRHLFGRIENQQMHLNAIGEIAYHEWEKLPERWPHLELGEFRIMPNHMHGIIIIHGTARVGAALAAAQITAAHPPTKKPPEEKATAKDAQTTKSQWKEKPTIGQIISAYKSIVVTEALKWIKVHNPSQVLGKIWQRNYWEHVIRDVQAFDNITNYIINNPANWASDRFSK